MFYVSINMNHAAFEDPTELPRLLEKIAEQIRNGNHEPSVIDSNGNRVGSVNFQKISLLK